MKILHLEDDTQIRDAVKRQLEDLGHTVLSAQTNKQALELLRQADLLLSDWNLLPSDGDAEPTILTAMEHGTPVIMLTGTERRYLPEEWSPKLFDFVWKGGPGLEGALLRARRAYVAKL